LVASSNARTAPGVTWTVKITPQSTRADTNAPRRSKAVIWPSSTLRALNALGDSVASKISPARIAIRTRSRRRVTQRYFDLALCIRKAHAHNAVRLPQIQHRAAQQVFKSCRLRQSPAPRCLQYFPRRSFTSSHGLQFLASYTWSHTLDVSTDSNNGGQPMNPYNWRQDYGNSNWDIRHRFVSHYLYELPFFRGSKGILHTALADWRLSGLTTLQSGLPFNVTISTDTANTNSRGLYRPNLVGTPSANCGPGPFIRCTRSRAPALMHPV